MDEKEEKTELDEELDDIDTEDSDNDVDTDDDSDEFEYDEDGNIIIPEVIDDEQEEETQDEEESEGEETDADENEGSEESEETAKPTPPAQDEKDREIAELKRKLAAYEAQGKETLDKLGIKSDSVMEGLEKAAAESDDISLEEYQKQKAEKQRSDEAQKLLQRTEFERKMKADLAEVQKDFPETRGLKYITEIENFVEFAKFRDKGLTPKQAYSAANPDGVRKSVATAVKQQSLNDTKSHLKSAVPKGSKDSSITMSKKELAEWRDIFPDKSDKELVKLYRDSLKK